MHAYATRYSNAYDMDVFEFTPTAMLELCPSPRPGVVAGMEKHALAEPVMAATYGANGQESPHVKKLNGPAACISRSLTTAYCPAGQSAMLDPSQRGLAPAATKERQIKARM